MLDLEKKLIDSFLEISLKKARIEKKNPTAQVAAPYVHLWPWRARRSLLRRTSVVQSNTISSGIFFGLRQTLLVIFIQTHLRLCIENYKIRYIHVYHP
jgi:hypothetical protein